MEKHNAQKSINWLIDAIVKTDHISIPKKFKKILSRHLIWIWMNESANIHA